MVVHQVMSSKNPAELSPLVLAYIGDAVYEVFTRNKVLCENPDMPAHKLHTQNVKYVKAKAQSEGFAAIEEALTEEETAVFKRGRNAKSHTSPKNAEIVDYRRATGFESLLGYLYLKGERERARELMERAYENIKK